MLFSPYFTGVAFVTENPEFVSEPAITIRGVKKRVVIDLGDAFLITGDHFIWF